MSIELFSAISDVRPPTSVFRLVIAACLIFLAGMNFSTASFISTATALLLRSRRWAFGAILLGVFCGGATMALAKTPPPDDKWRIVCIHDALSDGVIVFRLTPLNGPAQELHVPIKDGTYENDIARAVRDVFRATLAKELYHVETDDGEAVLVKKQRGKPNFTLEFVSNTVNGVGIRVELD